MCYFAAIGGPIATVRGDVRATALWDPDGAGPLPVWLVIGSNLTGGEQTAAVGVLAHDGIGWRGIGFPASGSVRALAVFNGELVAAGVFVATAGGVANNIARSNGSAWQTLGSGANGGVSDLALWNSELVASGFFTMAGGVMAVGAAKWNGTVWSGLSVPGSAFSGRPVRQLA